MNISADGERPNNIVGPLETVWTESVWLPADKVVYEMINVVDIVDLVGVKKAMVESDSVER